MKLELKHLAPYLPYGLKNQRAFHKPKVIDGIVGNKVYFGDTVLFINQIEPILRPLSDLTKEIEFDNEKFTPSKDKYWGMNSFQYHINKFENWESPSAYLNSCAPYGLLLVLIKWNFDVFGLIDAGLAIDINTL
tara:strand:+ start:288 stop:689 length:402 start_codon:yes stop_codon:yes gene_type:complete